MSDQYSLAGKVAAATVARQGKGRAIDIGLGAAGARVAVTDCVPESASSAAADIVAVGGTAFPVTPEVNSKALAAEFAALGIHVDGIVPGYMTTTMTTSAHVVRSAFGRFCGDKCRRLRWGRRRNSRVRRSSRLLKRQAASRGRQSLWMVAIWHYE